MPTPTPPEAATTMAAFVASLDNSTLLGMFENLAVLNRAPAQVAKQAVLAELERRGILPPRP